MTTFAHAATRTKAQSPVLSQVLSMALVAVIATGILFVAGHAQSAALHDAAHDMRHATGFPCH